MSVAEPKSFIAPPVGAPLVRFTAARYEELTRQGFFGPADKIELIDGYLVEKMPQNDPHMVLVDLFSEIFFRILPKEWTARCQLGVRLTSDTIPEPDVTIVPGPKRRYLRGKPTKKEIALVIEVADSSLRYDRTTKLRIYARDRLPVYWIVNIPGRVVEVYTEPKAGRSPVYRKREEFGQGAQVPVVLLGDTVAEISVDELFGDF
ncbi:MAG TPA: Uma2 family endonuclease [Gemmataceae bacterium]|nr:Uma2 family endonuclease [Gemmataceae bacterium]